MAARPESRFVLEQFGLKFMPLAEGVRRFMDEIEAGLPEAEVLVTEPAMCPDAIATTGQLPPTAWPDHRSNGKAPSAGGPVSAAAGSLVGGVERRDGAVWVSCRLDPTTDRFLVEHTQHGRPLLPAVMGAELLMQAAAAEPITATLDEPPFPFNPMVYQDDAPLRHGPAFRTLTGLFLDRSGGWGRLVAPAADVVAEPRGARGWTVPVALLDGCIVACAVYSYILCGRRVEVPVAFDRLRIVSQPRGGERCTARMLFRSQDQRESLFDIVLFGVDGRPLLAIDGLHLAVMGPDRSRQE
jgi:hypothetical protein